MDNFTKQQKRQSAHNRQKHKRLIHYEYIISQDKGPNIENNFTSLQHQHAIKAKLYHPKYK